MFGTKLDRLRDLERAVKVQITLEEQRVRRGISAEKCTAYPVIVLTEDVPPARRLIGPLPHPSIVRAWAIEHGYVPRGRSGPLSAAVLDIYRDEAFG